MAAEVKLTSTLQESVLAVLAHDDVFGKIVASTVEPKHFAGDYRVVAERCLLFWKTYQEAPKAHLDDELADILDDKNNRKATTFRHIIRAMVTLADGVNAKYVVDKVHTFVRMQELKDAILESAEQLKQPRGDIFVDQVEEVWNKLLRTRKVGFSPGTRLSDYEVMLAHLDTLDEFQIGITQLDSRYVVPGRGTVLLFLGAAGRGKSWFLINVGRRALAMRKKVLHITLEMSAGQTQQRYYQSIFAINKRQLVDSRGNPIAATQRLLLIDEKTKHLTGFDAAEIAPAFSLDSPMIREELSARVDHYSGRYDDLIIKRFPPRSLDAAGLRGYLDTLEATEGFIPDLLILDYIGLWKTDERNHRISLGIGFTDFRAICIERNMAGVTAHQLSKEGAEAVTARGIHVAEDWSMIGTSDIVLTYSCSDWEFEFGLGRLQASKVRDEQDRFNLLMTQHYATGQFCVESVYLPTDYRDMLKEAQEAAGIVVDEDDAEE